MGMMGMKVADVLSCTFSTWYPLFKGLSIKSHIIPLPQEFLDYLHADGVVLPESSIIESGNNSTTELEGDAIDWSVEDDSQPVAEAPSFPEFEEAVKSSIRDLGGSVFPKLNWSAPRDATWISFDRSLKCTCPSDVYLLLKSSDFIARDISQPFIHCSDYATQKDSITVKYELVLRKWQNFHPGQEFRCFVRNGTLIAISQRHHSAYYDFIGKQKSETVAEIQAFFYHMVSGKFPEKNYVFDVYRRDQGKFLILDFNPFGEVTDGLLFKWEELSGEDCLKECPEFRYIESPSGVQPSPYASNALPVDIVDLVSGQDPYKLMDLLHLRSLQEEHSDSSEEEGSEFEESDNNEAGTSGNQATKGQI